MHRLIQDWSSKEFYESRLEPDASVCERLLADLPHVEKHEVSIYVYISSLFTFKIVIVVCSFVCLYRLRSLRLCLLIPLDVHFMRAVERMTSPKPILYVYREIERKWM